MTVEGRRGWCRRPAGDRRRRSQARQDEQAEAAWKQRAINAEDELKAALRQRARQLADEKRALEEKLQAARSNNRFLDKRIAQLEAELASPRGSQEAT